MNKTVAATLFAAGFLLAGAVGIFAAALPEQDSKTDDLSMPKAEIAAVSAGTVDSKPVSNAALNEKIAATSNVKDIIFHNMLNSIDFFDSAEGEFVTTLIDAGAETVVTYRTDIPNQVAHVTENGSVTAFEQYCYDGQIIRLNAASGVCQKDSVIAQNSIQDRAEKRQGVYLAQQNTAVNSFQDTYQNRVVQESNGEKGYYYRTDVTNTGVASMSLFSQELVFGFLTEQDCWDIAGVETYLDRQAVVLRGTVADERYAAKLNVFSFEMRVDFQTGILLSFEGFSKDGALSQYMHTKSIQIDGDTENLKAELTASATAAMKAYRMEQ